MENKHIQTEIYVEDNSDTTNLSYRSRGYRRDLYVKHNDKYYKMTVFSYTCLKQQLENQYKLLGRYSLETNLIIVKTLNMEKIVNTILEEAKHHYFDRIKECQVIDGEIIYPLDEATIKCYKEANWPTSFPINKLSRIY